MDQSLKVVARGKLDHHTGKKVDYVVVHGWDAQSSMECDLQWKQATVELLTFIANQDFDDKKLAEVLASLSMEDDHWEWFKKALAFRTDEYEWFHLCAEGKPQGACVIYHPKESALNGLNIFYVEFIAVAPWNRKNLLRGRVFKGVGRALLTAALKFAVQRLKLSPGFCLHSLPGARDFYLGLQMVNVAARDKDTLLYFELPASCAVTLIDTE